MADSLGALAIKVMGDIAEFRTAMQQTQDLASQAAKKVDDAFSAANTSLKAFAIGLVSIGTITSLKSTFDNIVAGAAALDDMAERTGVTVERLSAFAAVAKAGGHSVESMEGAITKLAKGMAGADEETKGAGAALSYLGIKARDANGQLRSSGDVFEDISKRLNDFKDGTGKTAIAMDIFGKSGAQVLPLLKDMAEQGELVGKVTAEQAAQAENYEKAIKKLAASKEAWKKEVAFGVLPVAADFVQALLELKKKSDGLTDAAKALRKDGSITEWAQSGAMAIANLIDIGRAVPLLFKLMGTSIAGASFDLKAFADMAVGALKIVAAGGDYSKMAAGVQEIQDAWKRVGQGTQMAKDDAVELLKTYKQGMFADALQAQFDKVGKASEAAKKTLNWKPPIAETGEAVDQLQKQLEALYLKLDGGEDAALLKELDLLRQGFEKGKLGLIDFNMRMAQAVLNSSTYKNAVKEVTDAIAKNEEALNNNRQAVENAAQAMKDGNKALDDEIATIGMSKLQRDLYNLALQKTADLRRIDATLTGEEAEMRRKEVDALYAAREAQLRHKDTLESQISVWQSLSSTTEQFFTDLFENGRSAFSNLWTTIKRFFAQLAAQFATKFVLNIAASALGLGGAGIANAGTGGLLQLLGLGDSGGSALSGLLGGGSALGSLGGLMGLGSGAGILGAIGGGANLAITGLMGGGLSGMAGGIGMAFQGGMLTGLGSLLPILGPIAAIAGLVAMFAKDEKGFKIDNSVRGVGNPSSHWTSSALGSFDYSGDVDPKAFAPFTARINALDDLIANKLLDKETLESVRDRIQSVKNPRWWNLDDKDAINKASLYFLKERYGIAFDAINSTIAEAIRNFSGTSDEMLQYLDAVTSIDWKSVSGPLANAVAALSTTTNGVQQAIALLQSVQTIQALVGTDFVQAGIDLFRQQTATAMDAYIAQGEALDKLVDSARDGKIGYAELAQGAQAFAQTVARVMADIQAARANIDSNINDALRNYDMAGLSNEEKINYLRAEAERLRGQLGVATDPQQIQDLIAKIIADSQAAFALLTPEQQALLKGDYSQGLRDVQAEANARLQTVSDNIVNNTRNVFDEVQAGLNSIIDKMGAAADKDAETADKNNDAADKQIIAANTPLRVEIVNAPSEITGGV